MITKNFKLIFLLIVAVAIILRVIYLDKSLSGDEINSVLGAKQKIENIFSYVAKNDSYPPLQHLMLHFWLWGSEHEIWIRIFYIIFGIGMCLMAYLIGKTYVDKRFGMFSMLFVSISPQLVHLSQYVRGIIVSAFFVSLSIYFLLRILSGKRNLLNWSGYVTSTICASYSFYFIALIIIAENIYLALNYKRSKDILRNWIFCQGLIVISLIPWIPFFAQQLTFVNIANNAVASINRGFFIMGFHVGSFVRLLVGTFGLDPLFLGSANLSKEWPSSLLAIITLLSVFIAVVILFRATNFFRKSTDTSKISCWFFQSLIIIPIVLAMLLRHFNNFPVMSRYSTPICFFFNFIIVGAILSFRSKKIQNLLFAILAILIISRLPWVYESIEEWREAVHYVESKVGARDCIVFLEKGKNDYKYYSKLSTPRIDVGKYFKRERHNLNVVSISPEDSIGLLNLIGAYERSWVILTHTKIFGGTDVLESWFISNGFTEEDKKSFIGVDVLVFRGKE